MLYWALGIENALPASNGPSGGMPWRASDGRCAHTEWRFFFGESAGSFWGGGPESGRPRLVRAPQSFHKGINGFGPQWSLGLITGRSGKHWQSPRRWPKRKHSCGTAQAYGDGTFPPGASRRLSKASKSHGAMIRLACSHQGTNPWSMRHGATDETLPYSWQRFDAEPRRRIAGAVNSITQKL